MSPAASGSWLLTLDRGNSTLDCMLRGPDTEHRANLTPESRKELREFLAGHLPCSAVGCSAVLGGLDAVARNLADLGVEMQLAGRDLPCPLQLRYSTPETLGTDRWVAALAAYRQWGAACVVDLGTATTVDLVDGNGVYRGGAIAPGFSALVTALAAQAPALPATPPNTGFGTPPESSNEAVAMGVQIGFCGMVERLVADMIEGEPGPLPVLLTGGAAPHYLRHGRLNPVHVPDLVHRGLGLLVGLPCDS